jgi:hypothetical protein
MTSDDLTSSSTKKRPFESDDKSVDAEQISSANNSPSPAKIPATSTVNPGNTCDITWRVTLLLLNPLSTFEPSFLPLADLQKQ